MSLPPPSGARQDIRRRSRVLAGILLLAFSAGCATFPAARDAPTRRALRSIPEVPGGHLRADRALVAAFFSANGIPLSPAQLEHIIPSAAPRGRIDRNAIRRIATKQNRLLMVVKADERFLWDELGNNLPLLILLPPDLRYSPAVTPLIPVAWDRERRTLDLLDGNAEIQTLAEDDFFARREPLKHAALCLIKPGALRHFEPTREQKLLLADFWFDQGFYRRASAAYRSIEKETPAGADLDALTGRGNVLVRKGRYADAAALFRAALALEPDNPKILNNLAYAMLNGGGELLVALRHANKAAQLDPANPLVLETLGSINLRLGDPVAAAKYLEQAWARALKRSPEVQIAIMDQLVRAWLAADRKDLAWQVAEHRHRTFPEYRVPPDI
ncbi:MAG: tetratricopeptide repeat protein, partial [Opitutae bacterium]|nr:tetratricopeptide repeat protein [Opitutae bacterium]